MIAWDIGLFFVFFGVLSFVFFIFPWMPKQKSKVQTAFKKSIVFNGFVNEEYIYINHMVCDQEKWCF